MLLTAVYEVTWRQDGHRSRCSKALDSLHTTLTGPLLIQPFPGKWYWCRFPFPTEETSYFHGS